MIQFEPFTKFDKKKRIASDELVRRGKIRHLLTPSQKKFYDNIVKAEAYHYGFFASRKSGKSMSLFLFAIEHCINNPNHIVRIVLPEIKQAKEVYFPIFNELRNAIPTDCLPKLNRTEGKWQFKNGSFIILGGSTPENCEGSRGPLTHLLILDEIASFHAGNYEYLMKSILLPQLTTTNGIRLDATTPPRDVSHPWIYAEGGALSDYQKLKQKDNIVKFTIYDNPFVTEQALARIIDDYGGIDSKDFRREHLCELIADKELLLIPEFDKDKHVTPVEIDESIDFSGKRSTFWSGISVDYGLTDQTACLKAYYNHKTDTLNVYKELYIKEPTLSQFIKEITPLMVDQSYLMAPRIVVDIFPHAGFSLMRDHKFPFMYPIKGKVVETINYIRNAMENGKIVIDPSCKGLITCLELALWKENKTDIERNAITGHGDFVMALGYLLKIVPWGRIPNKDGISFANRPITKSFSKKKESSLWKRT
jgi:hypothetical protein